MRLGFAYQKSGFFVDESWSISISTNGIGMPDTMPNGEYFGKELKERVYFDDNSLGDLAHDLKELWKNNYGDSPHSNLYYTLLRIWNFDIKSGDFAWLKSRGIGLNLVFFALSFFASFILAIKLFSRTSFVVPLFLAMIFWNSASVTNTIFMRPYALQEMLLIVFVLNCFVFCKLDFCSAKDAFTHHRGFFVWFIFATALLCLSHYFSLFFIVFAFVFLALLSRKNIFVLSLVMFGSFAITQILYLGYFSSLFGGYRAKESTEKLLLGNFWQNLEQSFNNGVEILSTHFCNIYGLILLCIACVIALYLARERIRFPQIPKLHILANLKDLLVFLKPIAKNTLKPYKKVVIFLSAIAIFAFVVASLLIAFAKDNIQSAEIRLESINNSSKSSLYTAKIIYPSGILNARSKTVSNLIIKNIAWDNALDSSAITITQVKNRYIDFSTTQDLGQILNFDFGTNAIKPKIGVLSYEADFAPLLKVILRYYVVLLTILFLLVLYIQYAKIAWNQHFISDRSNSSDLSCESMQDSKTPIFLLVFFAVAIVWFCFVFFVAPYKDLRYVMSVFPFLYFGVIFVLNAIKKPILRGILGVCFVASLFANYNVKYLFREPFIFSTNPNIPVLVHLPTASWQQGAFIFAFNDTQRYIVKSDFTQLQEKMREFDAFYFISEKPLATPLGYKQSLMQKDWYGHFYLFEKSKKSATK